jgi:hypothetical protein
MEMKKVARVRVVAVLGRGEGGEDEGGEHKGGDGEIKGGEGKGAGWGEGLVPVLCGTVAVWLLGCSSAASLSSLRHS